MLKNSWKTLTIGLACSLTAGCGLFSDDHLVIEGWRAKVFCSLISNRGA